MASNKPVLKPVSNCFQTVSTLAHSHGQRVLRSFTSRCSCLFIACELKWLPRWSSRPCSSVHRSIDDLFSDGVLDMAHTHAFLQEEKEDGSIEEMFASFYNYEEDELRDCLTKKHWEYATTSIGLSSELRCR